MIIKVLETLCDVFVNKRLQGHSLKNIHSGNNRTLARTISSINGRSSENTLIVVYDRHIGRTIIALALLYGRTGNHTKRNFNTMYTSQVYVA